MSYFLDASSHLYMRSCPSVGWLVGPSVGNPFFLNVENEQFLIENHGGSLTLTLLNVLGVLNVLHVLHTCASYMCFMCLICPWTHR